MYFILLNWGMYIVWYLFLIILPNSFDRISENTLRRQEISSNSKLRFIYFNKNAFPQLKCIAIQAIVFFLSNIVYSLIACILFMVLDNTLIVNYISICYLSIFLTITGITILILNLKK